MFDVIVIGGGVVGGLILRELTKYRLRVCLLEKEGDVAMGQSKANSGIVHAGFDAAEGSLKAKFNVLGNQMMPETARQLGVKYQNNGSLVVAFSEEDLKTLEALKTRGEKNGVTGLEILSREALFQKEPNISDKALGALYAPTGGIVCPYELTIAAIGNAMDNGAELWLDFEVCALTKEDGVFTATATDGRTAQAKVAINCAGLGSGKVAALAGDTYFKVNARRGEYILLDRESGNLVSHTLFFAPTKAGKGVLVSPTADGNILLGPTSEEREDDSVATSEEGLRFVQEKAAQMCKNVPFYNTITSFAGTRAYCDRHDFILEESKTHRGLFHCAGVESPGLTSSPAIAKYVVETLVGGVLPLERNERFNGIRKPDYFFKELSTEEKNAVIQQDKRYGRIVCRCEQITEGEIVRAVTENPPARDIDGVKRRTRAGMGRCQGGFCQPQVLEIIARERGVRVDEVTKSGKNSYLLKGRTK